jgi:8-oxo-dGTP diphosphatase
VRAGPTEAVEGPGSVRDVREWIVGGAVIEGPEGLLLVRNRRRDGRHDWSPPGGVIDEGETLVEGLTREVREETGLVVEEWSGPLYEIDAVALDLDWHLTVQVWRAARWSGDIVVDDPDGIVVDARWVAPTACADHLAGCSPWVADPVHEWLRAPWEGSRRFGYRIAGVDHTALEVTRV